MWLFPLGSLDAAATQRLLQAEDELRPHAPGQEQAVRAVAKAVRRAAAGLKDPRRPLASFVFLGPDDTGQGRLAEALARFLYGEEAAVVRIEMAEYHTAESLTRLVGSPSGAGGRLPDVVRGSPGCVIYFNEVEKAHPDVLRLYFRLREEGEITDGRGRVLDFRRSVLVAATSVGSRHIPAACGPEDAEPWQRSWARVREEVERAFPPEFSYHADFVLFRAGPS